MTLIQFASRFIAISAIAFIRSRSAHGAGPPCALARVSSALGTIKQVSHVLGKGITHIWFGFKQVCNPSILPSCSSRLLCHLIIINSVVDDGPRLPKGVPYVSDYHIKIKELSADT